MKIHFPSLTNSLSYPLLKNKEELKLRQSIFTLFHFKLVEYHKIRYGDVYSWISFYMKPFKTFIFKIYIVTKN